MFSKITTANYIFFAYIMKNIAFCLNNDNGIVLSIQNELKKVIEKLDIIRYNLGAISFGRVV